MIFLFLLLALTMPAKADIFIVRHAEKKNPAMDKSLLSVKGLKRAQTLKKVLSSVNLKAVYCTEYERTHQTAAPTAADHGLTVTEINSEDGKGLVRALRSRSTIEDVLVIGHSDTIPDLLVDLGVSTKTVIGSDDFDNLFVVALSSNAAPSYHRLHY